jgi:hypothetical protein
MSLLTTIVPHFGSIFMPQHSPSKGGVALSPMASRTKLKYASNSLPGMGSA